MHIYLYSLEDGSCRQITKGDWVVRGIEHWDAESRLLYFSAAGREQPGVVDPYLRHVCTYRSLRCPAGSGFALTTAVAAAERMMHDVLRRHSQRCCRCSQTASPSTWRARSRRS